MKMKRKNRKVYELKIFDAFGDECIDLFYSEKKKALAELKKIEKENNEKIPKSDYEINSITLDLPI